MKIENDELLVEIKSAGAELTKIYSKSTNLNYLWKGDSVFWGRHAPVLFPIVGQVKGKSYLLEGEKYQLSQHGFARDQEFQLIQHDDDLATFELVYSEESLDVYPFKFALQITYQLVGNELLVNYEVINKDEKNILFSLGGHPAFNCPLVKGTKFEDYYLSFPKDENPQQLHLNTTTGLRNGKVDQVNLGRKIELNYDLFSNDALIYEGLASSEVSLLSNKHEHGLTFTFKNWKYMAFWTKGKNAPFLCLEPWCGITDADDSNGDFKTKLGIEKLGVEKRFVVEYRVEFF